MKTLNDLPQVSVVIPVYNAEDTIQQCLEKLCNQSYPCEKTEIIVVNNNSTDNSQKIINGFKVISAIEKKKGPSAARNTGIRRATGEIIIFTDADCLADNDFIHQHVRMHEQFKKTNSKYKIVGGGINGYNSNIWAQCDDFLSWHAYSPLLSPREESYFQPTANLSVIREILLNEDVYFDDDLFPGEDIAFCITLMRKGYKIYFHPGAVVSHINRTTFKGVLNHCLSWTKPEFALRKKGFRIHKQKAVFFWVFYYIGEFIRTLCYLLVNALKSRRYKIVFYLPLLLINIFI